MDAVPGEPDARLAKAEELVGEAAAAGAQLVVLPELFNTGYQYDHQNYTLAETLNGRTCTWMRELAASLGVHLAGTLLLRREGDIYNTMLLVAPDGQEWQYDKRYPFYWERAYFRAGRGITVAETRLGKLGMLICWDVGHANLFREYAGKIDAMLVSSCPPRLTDADIVFPDGSHANVGDMSGLSGRVAASGRAVFDEDLRAQTAYLGVPMIHATGTGTFDSSVPQAFLSLFSFIWMRPRLWGRLRQANRVRLQADYFDHTLVLTADGQPLAESAHGQDTFVVGDVILPSARVVPGGPQPKMRVSSLTHWLDRFVKAIVSPQYYRRRR
jgi:predicted amidohydrolase